MFRRIVVCLALITMLVGQFYSCRSRVLEGTAESPAGNDEPLAVRLEKDPEVAELMSFHRNLYARAEAKGLQGRDFVEAAEGSPAVAAAMFGYTTEEWTNMFSHLQELGRSIRLRYAEIDQLIEDENCSQCVEVDPYAFAETWDRAMAESPAGPSGVQARAPERCQIVPLIAGLILCALTAPSGIVYIICVYVVVCSFCEGGVFDKICP